VHTGEGTLLKHGDALDAALEDAVAGRGSVALGARGVPRGPRVSTHMNPAG
jgi:hypothetical protein